MAGVFDGVTGLIDGVFGAKVLYTPLGGSPREILSIFRELPVDDVDGDGRVVRDLSPVWRVRSSEVARPSRGSQIQLEDGRVFRIMAAWPSGSSASDAYFVCDLEQVGP